MCGIAGLFLYGEPGLARREVLESMVAPLRHRGPDDAGVYLAGAMGLGHARLSIIDVAGGHQPIYNEDRTLAVICNGEIYNHRELRAGLEARGHRFSTRSDCEVIVHLYEEMGASCVAKLAGMFALAVSDTRNRRLLLARDRVGKKPLYLADDGRRLGFASELKSLLAAGLVEPEVDPEALDLYLAYGYVPAPWTIFRGAAKLPAGHLAVCDAGGLRIERYWDVEYPAEPSRASEQDLVGELEELLSDAVRARLESEVPLGAFLSGGIDSGTLVALMSAELDQPVRTHTVGFSDRGTDEREDAAAVARALGTDHVATEVRPDLTDVLPRVAWHLDEPFADPSSVPTWYVSRETRRRVTVALSGDGGDELFAGYSNRYEMAMMEHRVRAMLPGALRRALLPPLARAWPRSARLPRPLRLGGFLGNLSVDGDRAYFHDRCLIPAHLQERLFGDGLRARRRRFDPFVALEPHLARAPREPLSRALYLDLKTWLADDGLVKVDRMSMAHSLEVRCPLLDHRLIEFAARVPSHLKLAGGKNKILLRRLAERRLPAEILARPKRGFAPPVSRWLREDLRGMSRDLLLGPDAFSRGLFERRALARLLDDHAAGRLEAGWAIWTLLMLEMWGREVARPTHSLEVPRAAAV